MRSESTSPNDDSPAAADQASLDVGPSDGISSNAILPELGPSGVAPLDEITPAPPRRRHAGTWAGICLFVVCFTYLNLGRIPPLGNRGAGPDHGYPIVWLSRDLSFLNLGALSHEERAAIHAGLRPAVERGWRLDVAVPWELFAGDISTVVRFDPFALPIDLAFALGMIALLRLGGDSYFGFRPTAAQFRLPALFGLVAAAGLVFAQDSAARVAAAHFVIVVTAFLAVLAIGVRFSRFVAEKNRDPPDADAGDELPAEIGEA